MMAEKDQPVAFDLGDVTGRGAGTGEDHRFVKRPIPSVPDNRLGGAVQAMSRMASPASDQGFQNLRNKSSSHVTRGFGRPPWMAGRLQADSGSEDNSSITMDSSLKKEVTEGPSTSAWDRPAPSMSKSLNRHEDSSLAQQARKAAFMYGSPLQALRANVARTSALVDEAQLGAHQPRVTLGAEPSSSQSAGPSGSPLPFYSRMKGDGRFENNGVQSPLRQQQQHPIQSAIVAAAGHGPETGKRPCTAQLTIFYAGMVNVYDEVPSDKAQAIMLLAGTGSAWSSSNYPNLLGSSGANPGRPSTAGGMNHPMSRAASPAPHSATHSAEPPSGAATKLPNRQVTTAVELPQARKASLARFLEKRKDRVRKGPYTHPNGEAATHDALKRNSRENSPSHPDASGKPPSRPLSPPGNETNNGSEPNPQPQTPPRRSALEDRSHGMLLLARQDCENSNKGAMVVAPREKLSPSR